MRQTGLIATILTSLLLLFPASALAQVVQASWFEREESNRLIPLDPDDPADAVMAEAMGVVYGTKGLTNAIHVCSGTFIGAAHGLFSEMKLRQPDAARDKYIEAINKLNGTFLYPLSQQTFLSNIETRSPWLVNADESIFADTANDFAFMTVELVQSRKSLPIVAASTADLIAFYLSGGRLYMYRGPTTYQRNTQHPDGEFGPDFTSGEWREPQDWYRTIQMPLRVEGDCRPFDSRIPGKTAHRCPTEGGVSGSPIVVTDNAGKPYLVGIHRNGGNEYRSRKHPKYNLVNGMVNSEAFCPMYEKVCARPCLPLQTVYSQAQ